MNSIRYWSVVASMGPGLETVRLSRELDALEPDDLSTFCHWLDEVEAAIDTPAHRSEAASAFELPRLRHVIRAWWAPEVPCPAVLEELQATVVAHGRDAWQMVAAGPAMLAGGWPTGLGRQFLLAVAAAWLRAFPDPQVV